MASLFHTLSDSFVALAREACPELDDPMRFLHAGSRNLDFVEIFAGFCRLTGALREVPLLHTDATLSHVSKGVEFP